MTAAAFLLAREEKADILVAEAGLGGRLDATNLLSDVACTAVASISMDHMEYLGDTLEKIAKEKFAVIRTGVPACYLGDAPELIPLFDKFCAGTGQGLVVSRDARVGAVDISEEGCVFDFAAPGLELKAVRTGLIGRYQVSNASLALAALSRLRGRFGCLTDSAIREGMRAARWPGRLEIVSRSPLVVLDGGHNRDGVAKLGGSVRELWGKGKKIGVVYGVMKDKDYPSCLNILNGLDASFYATCVPGMERSLAASALAQEARRLKWRGSAGTFENPLDAVARASGENDVVLVCGSLYLIGWIRPHIGKAAACQIRFARNIEDSGL